MNEEELRRRTSPEEKKEVSQEEVKPAEEKAVQPPIREYRPSVTDPSYRVEKDPRYRCLFIFLKVVIVILSLISFGIIFMNWIAPHLVSKERKLEVLRDHLVKNFCVYGECSAKDWEDINRILERARNEM